MRWSRRRKPKPSTRPARASLLPSWLLRFKKLGISGDDGSASADAVDSKPGKVIPIAGQSGSPDRFPSGGGPKLYRGAEASWKSSSRKERVDGDLQELLGNPVTELGEMKNFDRMVSRVQRMREVQSKEESLTDLKTPRRRKFTGMRRRRNRGKVGVEISGSSSSSTGSQQDCSFFAMDFKEIDKLLPELLSDEEQIAELRAEDLKNERHRKTLYVSGGSPKRRAMQSCRVRLHSPRANRGTEISRLRTDEQTKRFKQKRKKKTKEKGNGLERFAVVKCSFHPQQDFRDSMIEMISERRIRRPKELEELLACYLMLNSDKYHDVIIEVFRQLWFELNQPSCCEYDPTVLATEED